MLAAQDTLGRLRAVVTAAVMLVALALAAVAAAANSGWQPANGTGTSFFIPGTIMQRGANTVVPITGGGGAFSGTLSGPLGVDSGLWVIHPDGSSRAELTGVVTAAIGDCGVIPGGLKYSAVLFGQAQPDGSVSFTAVARTLGHQAARYVITLSGAIPPGATSSTWTYTGTYRCSSGGDDEND
jgi:hypothetical protein